MAIQPVTTPEQRGGLLVAVITGGRPNLAQRPTKLFLDQLKPFGLGDVVWVVDDRDAEGYETDEHDLAVYPRQWAFEYASEHWMGLERPDPDGFFGAFPGREWACIEAERRGCWGVLQLDDNISRLSIPRGGRAAFATARENGGLGLFADLLAGVVLSTNGRMVGANLDSVPQAELQVARAGFPYSLFIERVGPDREHWYGPFEDDITHGFQYGTRADATTAAVLPLLRYMKESKSKTGMRAKYNHTRAVQLQRIFPESAKIRVQATLSNGRGQPRVFHKMLNGAIRNPLTVHDPALFDGVKTRLEGLLSDWELAHREVVRAKIERRMGKVVSRNA
ncbi:GREB1-related protein [Mycobacteroides abscessus]|uniref:GREB1-related protein n=1 Tax=Mycobacteroides abscessus TaxID=36809 RepID=UPI0005E29145|nr:hypothetical protein [Mycobacteroides abscessus]CPR79340.1 Uncharacterised protein [Mycobacteroides abscessus]CPR88485.1 Uncharacterised protein [Mycobacteroides abscessus]CPS43421.1 Uncharacterised protein [Mycobacteroides abscessus]CPV03211.1 Uncharacterised protein [Mycobacteroides abscessus]